MPDPVVFKVVTWNVNDIEPPSDAGLVALMLGLRSNDVKDAKTTESPDLVAVCLQEFDLSPQAFILFSPRYPRNGHE